MARQLDSLAAQIHDRSLSLAAIARVREQLTALADRTAWLADDAARRHLINRIAELSQRLG
jgi:MoxR-like ATPase